jgi:rhodanese-related sulfurtransferase
MTIFQTDPQTLKSWQESNQVTLIDVREISENQVEKIENSILIPLGEVDVDKLPNLNGTKLVIYCRSGKRSMFAAQHLIAQNPNLEIYNLGTGIEGWKASNFEILTC